MNAITEWHTFSDNVSGLRPYVGVQYETPNKRTAFRYGGTATTNVEIRTLTFSSSDNTVFNVNGTDVRGAAVGYGGIGFTNGVRLGYAGNNTAYLNGWIGEYFIYNTELGSTQYKQIEGYLAWKWGLQASLPAGHPYLAASPTGFLTVSNKISALPFYTQFKPTSIAGCALWLDGADPAGTGTPPSNGATVSTWVDKSGNSANGTSIGTPTYSSSSKAISFNGSSAFSLPNGTIAPGSSNFTIFGVCYPTSFANYPYLYGAGGSSADTATALLFYPSGQIENGFYTDFMGIAPSGTVAINNLYLISTAYNGTRTLYINGTSVVSGTPSGTKNVSVINNFVGRDQINNNEFFYGTINEFIVFNTFITSTQRQQIESYLAAKWGLTAALPTFTGPLAISGCTLWLDGADTSTFTKSGSSITQWSDKSTSANHCTQATLANAPTVGTAPNGLTSVLFSSATTQLASINNIPYTGASVRSVICVFYLPVTGNKIVASFGAAAANNCYDVSIAAVSGDNVYYPSFYSNDILLNALTYASILVGTPCIIYTYYDGTTMGGWINSANNQSRSTTPATTSTPLYLGVRQDGYASLNGHIFESIHYNVALTTTQRQQIEGYLAAKWGIQSSLPATHPYYAASPYHPHFTAPAGRDPIVAALVPTASKGLSGYTPPTLSSGGTVTVNGLYRVHTFTTVGTTQFTLSAPASVQAQLLVVGGGGSGGGWNDGGGGGAGGLVYVSSMTLTAGTYSIIVGAGGTGLVYNSSSTGNNGGNSSAFGYTGIGGGGGGGGGNGIGLSGGCGGGGGFQALAGAATQAGGFPGCRGTSATGGVGQSGGAGGSTTGGGGGGMGSTGTNLVGGSGLQYSISGTAQFYAAGGGPGTDSGSVQPLGGSGIGGNGGWRQSNPGTYPPTPGATNTGSGGGGFTDIISGGSGFYGAGGSGIVILAFPN